MKKLLASLVCLSLTGCASVQPIIKEQTTHPAIAQDAFPRPSKEFKYDNKTYYYISNWKKYERALYADLDYDGQNEAVISFAAGTKPDGWKEGDVIFYMPFYQIYKKTGKEYALVKTIVGHQYLGGISVQDFSKDGRKQLVIWSSGGEHYTDIYIYEWREGEYKKIFENGSACEVRLESNKKIPEIWIGREDWNNKKWSYSDEPLWEVYVWNGKEFVKK
jgi:hypothetical protein